MWIPNITPASRACPRDGFLAPNYTTESSISSYILSLQWQFATLGDNFVHPWLEGLPSYTCKINLLATTRPNQYCMYFSIPILLYHAEDLLHQEKRKTENCTDLAQCAKRFLNFTVQTYPMGTPRWKWHIARFFTAPLWKGLCQSLGRANHKELSARRREV